MSIGWMSGAWPTLCANFWRSIPSKMPNKPTGLNGSILYANGSFAKPRGVYASNQKSGSLKKKVKFASKKLYSYTAQNRQSFPTTKNRSRPVRPFFSIESRLLYLSNCFPDESAGTWSAKTTPSKPKMKICQSRKGNKAQCSALARLCRREGHWK